jgi:transposase
MPDTRRSYETDLTDEEWQLVQPLVVVPQHGPGPRRSVDLREVVNALLYKECTGCQWRMLPLDLPPRSTVSGYYQRWKQSGVWEQIGLRLTHRELIAQMVSAPHHHQRAFAPAAMSRPTHA